MIEIKSGRNIVNAHINADGNVIVGDGNQVAVINLKEADQYKTLESEIQELDRQLRNTQEKIKQYPNDEDFPSELLIIDQKRTQKKSDLETLKAEVIKLAEDFQRIPLDTERLRLAKNHFNAGEFKEARAVFDAEIMGLELDALLREKEQLNEKTTRNQQNLSDKANEYLILARLIATDFNQPERFEQTKGYFEQSLRADKNHENLFAYAYFLKGHNQYRQAQPLYEEALKIRRQMALQNPQAYLPDVAMVLNNLANLYLARKMVSQAQLLYEEALQIYRRIAQQSPENYLPYVAAVLNNLASLYYQDNEFSQAQPLYEDALNIYSLMAQQSPETYLPDVAMTLNNLASLYYQRKEFGQAQPLFEGALKIRRQMAQKSPQSYLPDVAMTLNNLASLYSDRNEFSQAQPLYEEALQIYRQMAQQSPQAYLPYVATMLYNLANLNKARKEFSQAQPLYEEALQIYRQMAQQSPETYLLDVAMTLNNLGLLYKTQKEFSQARSLYEEALQIYRQMAQQNPKVHNLDVAMTSINIGLLYEQLLETTVDKSLKTAGLALLGDAELRLAIYPEEHLIAQQYSKYIAYLNNFFKVD